MGAAIIGLLKSIQVDQATYRRAIQVAGTFAARHRAALEFESIGNA